MKSKKNILLISPEFPPYTNWGGIAQFNYSFATMLGKNGYHVYVITYMNTTQKSSNTMKAPNNVTRIYVPFKSRNLVANFLYYWGFGGIPRAFIRLYNPNLLFILDWNIFSFITFLRLTKKISISFIHAPTHHNPAFLIGIYNRFFQVAPLILHIHGLYRHLLAYEKSNKGIGVLGAVEKISFTHLSDHIVTCSRQLQKILVDNNPALLAKTSHIPNFINTGLWRTQNTFNRNRIVFFGRLEYRKGIDILLRVFTALAKNNKALQLYLIGDRSAFFHTCRIPGSVAKRVHIMPRIDSQTQLSATLARLQGIAVFPARYEPFGLATLEAMSLGNVVVASSRGGGGEIIASGKDGFLCEPTYGSVYATLTQILRTPQSNLTTITKRAVQKMYARYDVSRAARSYQELHRRLSSKG